MELLSSLQSVIAAEIGRLAHFGDRVGAGALAFADDQRDQIDHALFERVGGAFQDRGALGGGDTRPGFEVFGCAGNGRIEGVGRREWDGGKAVLAVGQDFVVKALENGLPGKIQTQRVEAVGIKVAWQGDARVGCVGLRQCGERIGDERFERHLGVGDLVHERGVGAVLEEAPHQVGQELVVAAHRCVDAADNPILVSALSEQGVVERVAHSQKLLELELAVPGKFEDRRDRPAVVGGEGGVDSLGCRKQLGSAGDVGDVGSGLAREDRVIRHAELLCALHLAVPVSPLHEANGKATLFRAAECDQPLADGERAFLICLNCQTGSEFS